MKHLPKSTPTEILNDPYGFTYKEMSEVIGEDKARALYTELYKQPFHKKNLSISTKKVYKSSDTEKYVYELKDNRYIETVFIKRRDGGTVCVSTQVGCSVGCILIDGELRTRKYEKDGHTNYVTEALCHSFQLLESRAQRAMRENNVANDLADLVLEEEELPF